MCKDFFTITSSPQRYNDFEVYQSLCEYLWIHQSKRFALFGIGDFYEHAKKLLTTDENLYRVEKIKNTQMYSRFIF